MRWIAGPVGGPHTNRFVKWILDAEQESDGELLFATSLVCWQFDIDRTPENEERKELK